MRYDRVDDGELLVAAARGDQAAFEAFYRRWLPSVLSYHLRRTASRELAFDLTAETFAAVVESCRRFDRSLGSAPAWLFEIAEHKLLDSVRRRRVESAARARLGFNPVELHDSDLERVEALASQGTEGRTERLLGRLSAEQRQAVRARVIDDRSYVEIASEMACSQAVVRQRVSRALRQLRDQLEERA